MLPESGDGEKGPADGRGVRDWRYICRGVSVILYCSEQGYQPGLKSKNNHHCCTERKKSWDESQRDLRGK